MTKWKLFSTLADNGPIYHTMRDSAGCYHTGIVQAIEREDGSGRSFNVRMFERVDGNNWVNTFHVRTID